MAAPRARYATQIFNHRTNDVMQPAGFSESSADVSLGRAGALPYHIRCSLRGWEKSERIDIRRYVLGGHNEKNTRPRKDGGTGPER